MHQHRTARTPRAASQPDPNADTLPTPFSTRSGVLTASGYGLRIFVERGHLIVQDGVGRERRTLRLARASCGLRRLVVLGHTGSVSLEALRWLHDLGAAFIQIGADGEVIAVTAPPGLDHARLRRAQALAATNDMGRAINRDLLRTKLERQSALAGELGTNEAALALIDQSLAGLDVATTVQELRSFEGSAATAYWSCFSAVPVRFTNRDKDRVPEHWRRFEARRSLLTGTSRTASNPANALLNYAYALLETETRVACLTVGLDPGMGLFHADQRGRDSLALDLMEPVRPLVDRLIVEILAKRVFTATDFFETRQGNCRLMPSVTTALAELIPQLGSWVGPVVEEVAQRLMRGETASPRATHIPTWLTQANRSAGRDGIRKGARTETQFENPVAVSACKQCGQILPKDRIWCDDCYGEHRAEKDRANVAKAHAARERLRQEGRDPLHTPEAAKKRSDRNRELQRLNLEWEANPTHVMTETDYRRDVLPHLTEFQTQVIARAIGLSRVYSSQVRTGQKIPHPRHWLPITELLKLKDP
jgi:CRISPR-associated endonuclease Cas1